MIFAFSESNLTIIFPTNENHIIFNHYGTNSISTIHKENIIFIDLDSLENKKIKTPDALEQLIKKLSVSQEKNTFL